MNQWYPWGDLIGDEYRAEAFRDPPDDVVGVRGVAERPWAGSTPRTHTVHSWRV